MKNFAIVIVTVLLAQGCGMISVSKADKQEASKKPNVIIFYVDDLGYADVSSYGAIGVETPNVDQLVSNGLKFTGDKKPIVTVACHAKDGSYVFSVKDNGIGIPKEYHQKIFKIFQSLNTHKDSTGIGLSIVKKIVDLYKGDIWLESIVGEGTTFFFTLEK